MNLNVPLRQHAAGGVAAAAALIAAGGALLGVVRGIFGLAPKAAREVAARALPARSA